MSGKTLELFKVEDAIIDRVRDIANPATPVDSDAVKDLAQAFLKLEETAHKNSMALGQTFVDMPPILTYRKPEEAEEGKPTPK